jgi:Sulfotransferase domain
LWSVPRARSTAFFRMMAERADVLCLHEPFTQVADFGSATIGDALVTSEPAAIAAVRRLATRHRVFFKDTTDFRYPHVLADRQFLRQAAHALLIRHPREAIASHYALNHELQRDDVGFTRLRELWDAITAAGPAPVVLDSDALIERPGAIVAAYCERVRLPFRPEALTWAPGPRPEWGRTQRWHVAASSSQGFDSRIRSSYADTVNNNALLASYYRYHLPAYEYLYQRRMVV